MTQPSPQDKRSKPSIRAKSSRRRLWLWLAAGTLAASTVSIQQLSSANGHPVTTNSVTNITGPTEVGPLEVTPLEVLPLETAPLFTQSNGPFTPQVTIEDRDGYRYITSNGIPAHEVGRFPNPGNPNAISEQSHTFRVTLTPALSGRMTPARPIFGVALNGVTFEPGTGEFWGRDRASGWNYEALTGHLDLGVDMNNAHVQPTGSYHYHGLPHGLLPEEPAMTLVGYAGDGFPIYGPYGYTAANDSSSGLTPLRSSYQLKAGQRPGEDEGGPGGNYDGTFRQDFEYVAGLGDLDECNGRVGVTPEQPEGIYHYVLTDMYPFVPRCFKGTPDESFERISRGGPGGGRRPRGGPGGERPSGRPGHRPPRPPRPPRHPGGGHPPGPPSM